MPALNPLNLLLIIAVVSSVTIFTRALPFLFFSGNRQPSKYVLYVGNILPPAVMAMLLLYSIRSVTPLVYPYGLPEFISIAVVVLLHIWKRNNLISILGGTLCYMSLVQIVFASV
jgi:branched-subunit amino acid transport protein AzlD